MQFDENAPVVKPHRLESCQTAEETWAEASRRQGPEGQTLSCRGIGSCLSRIRRLLLIHCEGVGSGCSHLFSTLGWRKVRDSPLLPALRMGKYLLKSSDALLCIRGSMQGTCVAQE